MSIQLCFQIISCVGDARSKYIEAIQKAKQGLYEEAIQMIKEGELSFLKGHHAHAKLIQNEANGHNTVIALLLVHAEDQLMSAEAFCIIAKEFIDLYKKLD